MAQQNGSLIRYDSGVEPEQLDTAVLDRRAQVAKLYFRTTVTITELAERFGVSHTVIWRDLQAMKHQWVLQTTAPMDEIRAVHYMELEHLKKALWEAVLDEDGNLKNPIPVGALAQIQSIIERQIKLLGADAPTSVNLRMDWRMRIQQLTGHDPDELVGPVIDGVFSRVGGDSEPEIPDPQADDQEP